MVYESLQIQACFKLYLILVFMSNVNCGYVSPPCFALALLLLSHLSLYCCT
jgi:hypothetical protein